ncbi:MAG: Ig-like domain-containing protein [Porphyromonadaceae bacterium]|nr:Ig-like domain-containing protein [Porphyromonadaceae bacterium]
MKKNLFFACMLGFLTALFLASCSRDNEPVHPIVPETTYTMSVSPKSVILKEGDYAKLNVKVDPTPEEKLSVTMTSADEKIAKVDNNGLVTALREGKTTISVKAVVKGKELVASVPVNVTLNRNYEIVTMTTDLPEGSDITISVGAKSGEAFVDFGDGEFMKFKVSPLMTGKDAQGTKITGKVGKSRTITVRAEKFFLLYVDNMQITNIDISKVVGLLYLHASNNKISNLKFAHLRVLKELILDHNKLTSLKLTKESSDLAYVVVDDNEITSVHIDPEMEVLREFTISRNKLKELHIPQGLTGLDILKCSQNQLTTLDISMLSHISLFYATYNQLTDVKFGKHRWLGNIRLNGNKLTELNISKESAADLYRLKLYGNRMTAVSMEKLADILPKLDKEASEDSYIMLYNNAEQPTEATLKKLKDKNWKIRNDDK